MKSIFLLLACLLALTSCSFLRSHNYWYTAGKTVATSGAPMADVAWGYCDMKCTYLQKYYPNSDFVVITFTESTFKPDFAACYIAKAANGTSSYTLWNTVAQNTYFESNCGGDNEDYFAQTLGATPKYKISGDILGVGIGTEITY